MISKAHEVARKTLNLEDVRSATVALPPLAEQARIVGEVERRLSVVEEVEGTVSANLERVAQLRQSILECAFAGLLVPQDPKDESANLLLTRLRPDDVLDISVEPTPRKPERVKRERPEKKKHL
jgi:type I restriction enzyme S subunit